jgi:hypothetical protein
MATTGAPFHRDLSIKQIRPNPIFVGMPTAAPELSLQAVETAGPVPRSRGASSSLQQTT